MSWGFKSIETENMYHLLPWSREQEWGWNKHEELDRHKDSILKLRCGDGCTKLNLKKITELCIWNAWVLWGLNYSSIRVVRILVLHSCGLLLFCDSSNWLPTWQGIEDTQETDRAMSMREFLKDWVNLAGRIHHKCRPHLSMARFWSAENRKEAERL